MVLAGLRLGFELHAWRRAGRTAQLWWRDDDARALTPALRRLLELSDRHTVPLALAVIPEGLSEEVAEAVAARPQVMIVQHGVDHRNRCDGPAAGEFPPSWTSWELAARLRVGWARLEPIEAARKVFVPPWNDIPPGLPEALVHAGYAGFSAWGAIDPQGSPLRIDAHLDLLRWRRGPRFRGVGRFEAALAQALRTRRRSGQWDAPIGLLTHHLDHDEAAWSYLAEFLCGTTREPALAWCSLERLMAKRRTRMYLAGTAPPPQRTSAAGVTLTADF